MSDIPEHLNKIKTSITELTANIEKLGKTVNEDSNETGKQFKLVVGKTQKCQSMLNILELKLSDYLSGDIKLQLDKISSTTKDIKTSSEHMNCRAMMNGFEQLNTLKSKLEESFELIRLRTTHLMIPGCNTNEGT